MANKIRVFISSTMEDLQNERRAVARRLQAMNVEPVNAETILPTGGTSWEVIEDEIKDCHLFVLILGSSYGWVPDSGYGAGQNKSVTHLEWDLARRLGKPVYAYLKHLSQAEHPDPQRDAFRNEVSGWSNGVFRAEFNWADDLADKVWETLTDMWTKSVLKDLVREQDMRLGLAAAGTHVHAAAPVPIQMPAPNGDEWVLLAGAGLSIAAGYPTAPTLMSVMAQQLWPGASSRALSDRYSFSQFAAFYEARLGRAALFAVVKDLLSTPQEIKPTVGHFEAVGKFKTTITSNLDELFELACLVRGIPYEVITPATQTVSALPGVVTIFKVSGTISDPGSLLLTLSDYEHAYTNKKLFAAVCARLTSRRIAVVGHSLRNEYVLQLLSEAHPAGDGLYVNPELSATDEIFLEQFKLKGRQQTADQFLSEFKVG